MSDIKLTIEGYGIDELMEEASRRVLQHPDFDLSGIKKKVDAAIDAHIKVALEGAIVARVDAIVEQWTNAPLKKTNSYGEPTGETTTLREIILKKFEDHLQMKVDENGRVDSYGSDRNMTRVQRWIKAEADDLIKNEATKHIKAVRAEAEKQISAAVGAFIAQNLVAPTAAALLPK